MTDIADRLQEIRERVEAATEGPWRTTVDHLIHAPRHIERSHCLAETYGNNYSDNARWIASARSDVPYLLSLVERLVAGMPEGADTRHQDPELVRALRDAEVEG